MLPPSGSRNLAEFYRAKAHECMRLAECASLLKARVEWIELANAWTALALHAETHSR